MPGEIIAHDLNYGERFWCFDELWQHCGWYSAVEHICGFCLRTGERKVIAHVEPVVRFVETFEAGLGI